MSGQDNQTLLNNTLIQMSHSFLQYVAESSPWVRLDAGSIESQIRVLAARQRQDVAEIVSLLLEREHHIDFGTFPTEYTDLQFLSLEAMMGGLIRGQQAICQQIRAAEAAIRSTGDTVAADVLAAVEIHEENLLKALNEIQVQLTAVVGTV